MSGDHSHAPNVKIETIGLPDYEPWVPTTHPLTLSAATVTRHYGEPVVELVFTAENGGTVTVTLDPEPRD